MGTCERILPECIEQAQPILLLNVPNDGWYFKKNELIGLKLTCGHMVLYDAAIEQIYHEFL